jgi:hypothetical protein
MLVTPHTGIDTHIDHDMIWRVEAPVLDRHGFQPWRVPRKLIPQRKEGVNYDPCTADGTSIAAYGCLPLDLSMGLRRVFMWRFTGR